MPDLNLQLFIPLLLRSFPSSCCHSFSSTQFYKVLQRREKEVKIQHKAVPCFLLYRHLHSSLSKSFHFLQQPDSISDSSLSVIALIFPNFSALTTLLLNSLCCLQSMKNLHEIVRFSISSSLLPFLFHWIALQRCFTGNLSAGESQSQIFILISRTMNCQRILVLVLLSLNFMCGISPSTHFLTTKQLFSSTFFVCRAASQGKIFLQQSWELRLSCASLKEINGWWELTQAVAGVAAHLSCSVLHQVLSCVPCVCSEEWQQNIPNLSRVVSSSGQCHFVKEAKINVLNPANNLWNGQSLVKAGLAQQALSCSEVTSQPGWGWAALGGTFVLPEALAPRLWVWLTRKCWRLWELLVCCAWVDHPAMSNVSGSALKVINQVNPHSPSPGHVKGPAESWHTGASLVLPPPHAPTSSSSKALLLFPESLMVLLLNSQTILLVPTGSHLVCGPCVRRIQAGRQWNRLLPEGAPDLVCYNLSSSWSHFSSQTFSDVCVDLII